MRKYCKDYRSLVEIDAYAIEKKESGLDYMVLGNEWGLTLCFLVELGCTFVSVKD